MKENVVDEMKERRENKEEGNTKKRDMKIGGQMRKKREWKIRRRGGRMR